MSIINANPQSQKLDEIILKNEEKTLSIQEPDYKVELLPELSDPDFKSSSESSKMIETVEENKKPNKDIEKHEKIEDSQIDLPDNAKLQSISIFDGKERCYDDSHIQLLK